MIKEKAVFIDWSKPVKVIDKKGQLTGRGKVVGYSTTWDDSQYFVVVQVITSETHYFAEFYFLTPVGGSPAISMERHAHEEDFTIINVVKNVQEVQIL